MIFFCKGFKLYHCFHWLDSKRKEEECEIHHGKYYLGTHKHPKIWIITEKDC